MHPPVQPSTSCRMDLESCCSERYVGGHRGVCRTREDISAQTCLGRCVADPVENDMCHHVNDYSEGLTESVHWATSADVTDKSLQGQRFHGMPMDCQNESQTTH